MDILGLNPFLAAILIACIGIAGTNVVAWLKNDTAFDPRKVAASAIIGFPMAVIFVGTEITILAQVQLTELEAGLVLIGLISQIAGFDTIAKNGAKVLQKTRSKTQPGK